MESTRVLSRLSISSSHRSTPTIQIRLRKEIASNAQSSTHICAIKGLDKTYSRGVDSLLRIFRTTQVANGALGKKRSKSSDPHAHQRQGDHRRSVSRRPASSVAVYFRFLAHRVSCLACPKQTCVNYDYSENPSKSARLSSSADSNV